ncbi:protein maelstrom homolog [Pectinophora gossypiella]|nr:protein maelstrom homolog [Pectinophora gossypiella]
MPKKPPRNAFYYFMLDFKEQQRKKGINYGNMNEVAQAAGPEWTSAKPQVRAKFEAIAKAEKAKSNVPEQKFTSTGQSLAELEALENERRAAEKAEERDILNFVKQKSVDGSILDEDMYLMDVNYYCKTGSSYLIGELALLRFSIRDGIKNTYHEIINPGGIPMGYALDVKQGCVERGLAPPDPEARRADLAQLLANVVDFLRQGADAGKGALPALYTMPQQLPPVADFVHQMCYRAAEDAGIFRLYRLDLLLYQLSAHVGGGADVLPRESLALQLLLKDPFKYSPGLACELHERADKATACSAARVRRWAFTVLDALCARLALPVRPGRHLPASADLDSILAYREAARAGPAAAGLRHEGGAACDTSYGSSLDTSSRSEKKRTHVPLRMPKTDYAGLARAAPALQLDEHFPPLSARGRGRGLGSSFDKMKI